MCDFFDDGIDNLEMALILGITEEIEEGEKSKLIDNGPESFDEMLRTPLDDLEDEEI